MQQCRGLCDRPGIRFYKNPHRGSLAEQGACYCKTCENTIYLSSVEKDIKDRPICQCCHNKIRIVPKHVDREYVRIEVEPELIAT